MKLLLSCLYLKHSNHSSSSHFWMSGMSKSSAKSGGKPCKPCSSVQLPRSQFKCVEWCTPSVLSSEIFASSAGISEIVVGLIERVWMICTRSASAIRSRVRRICFGSVTPERVVNRTNAANSPISVSLRPYSFRPFAKFWNAFANSFCSESKSRKSKWDSYSPQYQMQDNLTYIVYDFQLITCQKTTIIKS